MDMSGSPGLAMLFTSTQSQMTLDGLQTLKMAKCDLKYVPEKIINIAPNLLNLDISFNPLICTHNNLGWIQHSNVTLMNPSETICSLPQNTTGESVIRALNFHTSKDLLEFRSLSTSAAPDQTYRIVNIVKLISFLSLINCLFNE